MTHEELVERFYVDNHPTLAMYSPTLYRQRVKELLDKAAADEMERCAKKLDRAVNGLCSCGGSYPGDPRCCVACKVFHAAGIREGQMNDTERP